ncbi:hypothetical protein ACN4EG_00075 [Alkalinema pantanalense CENA528]|uniref:hypothetical protein n=1 Tax=Alkalinema pantanalense TaxID=1620705 RepID=UPI003D6FE551
MKTILKITVMVAFAIGVPTLPALQKATVAQETAPTTAPSIWKQFTSETGKFTVLMPGEVKEQVDRDLHWFEVERTQEEVRYSVAYEDFSAPIYQTTAELEDAFAGLRRTIGQENGKILAESRMTLKGYPGIEFKLTFPKEGATGRARVFIAKQRVYTLVVKTNREKNLTRSVDGFFQSFQLSD